MSVRIQPHSAVRALIVVIVWLAAAAGPLVAVFTAKGVYYSQVDIVLLAPLSVRYPNTLTTTSGSLIATAGVLERLLNEGVQAREASSTETTLVGQGVRRGFRIALPDSGGQWAHNFDRQVLDLQVVGASKSEVEAVQNEQVKRIGDLLARMQGEAGVAPENLVTATTSAPTPSVIYVGPERKRAGGMALAIGAAAAGLVARYLCLYRSPRLEAYNDKGRTG